MVELGTERALADSGDGAALRQLVFFYTSRNIHGFLYVSTDRYPNQKPYVYTNHYATEADLPNMAWGAFAFDLEGDIAQDILKSDNYTIAEKMNRWCNEGE